MPRKRKRNRSPWNPATDKRKRLENVTLPRTGDSHRSNDAGPSRINHQPQQSTATREARQRSVSVEIIGQHRPSPSLHRPPPSPHRRSRHRRDSSSSPERGYYRRDSSSSRDRGYHSSVRNYTRSRTRSGTRRRRSSSRSSRGDRRRERKSYRSSRSNSRGTSNERRNVVVNDKENHLVYKEGEVLANRFKLIDTIGEGTFGKVVRTLDIRKNKIYALKIVRNVRDYREDAKMEINVLSKIRRFDPTGKSLCVSMLDWFNHFGHMCILFNIYGQSVYDFQRENHFSPFPRHQVRRITHDMCRSVNFLHKNRLTHTDLKPENILFRDSTSQTIQVNSAPVRIVLDPSIRVIDFGSATFDHEHHSRVVQTRHYRAPEVILEQGWSQPCDVWSIGCIIYELAMGNTLFQTLDNNEHLMMMERVLGPIPVRMASRNHKAQESFPGGRLMGNNQTMKYVQENSVPLFELAKKDGWHHRDWSDLLDLLARMLEYEPARRITLGEALNHPFLRNLN